MKRILFVVTSLGCGGINRSLENLLSFIGDDIEPSILTFVPSGQYEGVLNKGVEFIKAGLFLDYLNRNLSKQTGIDKLISLSLKTSNKLSGGRLREYLHSRLSKRLSSKNYDAIVAFSEGLPTYFVAKTDINNKIAWIHCDYKSYLSIFKGTVADERQAYSKYRKIVCVSDYTMESFKDAMPECAENAVSLPNVLDVDSMKRQAEEYSPDYEGDFNIVTVGRIDPIKHQSVIPELMSQIVKHYPKTHWYIVGPDASQQEYKNLISEISKYGLNDSIHLLGQKDNPYPYIKRVDLLVNTSISEACPYVINEAKVLGTPVVCTDFGSASQFIKNGFEGFSVSLADMPGTIMKLMSDKDLYNSIKVNLAGFNYDNDEIVTRVVNMF